MLSGSSLAGILGLVFGPPILIFFSVMALKFYLRITSDEEELNEVRTRMQSRRSRQILGLEGASGPLSLANTQSFVDVEDLAQNGRQTREERIQDCINVFTVPDNSSAFIRFAMSDSNVDSISEIEPSETFSSVRFDIPPMTNTTSSGGIGSSSRTATTPQAPASVKSVQTAKSAKSKDSTGNKSFKSQKSSRSQKSRASTKSRGGEAVARVSMTARRSINSVMSRIRKPKRGSTGDVCIICMDGYRHGDVVCKTKCSHVFHKECVEEWMKKHNRCPLCRKDLFEH